MKKAISVVFVEMRHQLCMWHVMHKLSQKGGVRLCNSTNFKERICYVVGTDILTPEEFESGWEEAIGEFNFDDNDWLSDISALRESWIPAYYRMEELSGLMRMTSRSENLDPDVQSIMREIIFATEYTLNRLSFNKEELSLYKNHVQSYMKKVQDMQIVASPPSTRDRFAEITGQYQNDKNPIRVPVRYKSKGSGSHKRLKSKQEEAIEKTKTKGKTRAKERLQEL
ncbi:protein FAR1-RELATED SEQUENCE 1-like [Helianthus annuus]|uniref:protein FAR1-RELATED SEQUENCE 1-like n=1 Tax=Helianthus annuus TaxID=4232 RepID=UPI000B902B22|nr:protein FAR1-RELATED SEQUENCE 1-like [Helianthus annuus]